MNHLRAELKNIHNEPNVSLISDWTGECYLINNIRLHLETVKSIDRQKKCKVEV